MPGFTVTFFEYTLELEGPNFEFRLYKRRDDPVPEQPDAITKVIQMRNRRIKK
jgi:hypothetical protein